MAAKLTFPAMLGARHQRNGHRVTKQNLSRGITRILSVLACVCMCMSMCVCVRVHVCVCVCVCPWVCVWWTERCRAFCYVCFCVMPPRVLELGGVAPPLIPSHSVWPNDDSTFLIHAHAHTHAFTIIHALTHSHTNITVSMAEVWDCNVSLYPTRYHSQEFACYYYIKVGLCSQNSQISWIDPVSSISTATFLLAKSGWLFHRMNSRRKMINGQNG